MIDYPPMIVSRPLILNWSLSETGRPCNGPITVPWVERWISSSLARARARSMKISVKQFVFRPSIESRVSCVVNDGSRRNRDAIRSTGVSNVSWFRSCDNNAYEAYGTVGRGNVMMSC